MFIDPYYQPHQNSIRFSAEQGSLFAKQIANDFNPLHNPDNKLFCVPGDLLFAIIIMRYGLSEQMHLDFTGMIKADVEVELHEEAEGAVRIKDASGKQYMSMQRAGSTLHEPRTLEQFARSYVAFSGQNFPDLLIPLMQEKGVIINPKRPLVLYQGMEVSLTQTQGIIKPSLEYDRGILQVEGKKGEIELLFNLISEGRLIGTGKKRMQVRGLIPFDESVVRETTRQYEQFKSDFLQRD